MNQLTGKTAVITGGTRGFGLAIARLFVQEGARVVIASRSAGAVDAAVTDLKTISDGHVTGIPADVSIAGDIDRLAQHAVDTFGGFDIWVNNAAVSPPYGRTCDLAPDAVTAAFAVNIHGTYYGSITAVKHFLARGSGKLINVLGDGATRLTPMQSAYGSSKAWMRSFTLSMAKEYADTGIGIHLIQPGLMLTDMVRRVEVIAGDDDRMKVFPKVLQLLAYPPEVSARRVLALASARTDGRTGLEWQGVSRRRVMVNALVRAVRAWLGKLPLPDVDVTAVPSALDE